MEKKYVIKLDVVDAQKVSILTTLEITGATMEELLSKLPLKVAELMRKENEIITTKPKEEIYGKDDDVPF